MKLDLTDELLKREIQDLQYPNDIDVVDAVMSEIKTRPFMIDSKRRTLRKAIAISAACLVLAISIPVAWAGNSVDEHAIGSMLDQVYAFDQNYAVEMCAEDELNDYSVLFNEETE